MNPGSSINGINYSNNPNINMSYAHSVLQSLYSLFCIRGHFLNDQNFNLFPNLSKYFYFLLRSLQNGLIGDSSNLIFNYNKNSNESALKTDPYHFLFYFLDKLHLENNNPSNPYYDYSQLENASLNCQMNDNYMYSLFCSFFQSTQNSIISKKFYNIIKFKKSCKQCKNSFYKYYIRKIFKFYIDDYFKFRNEAIPAKANNPKLDLDECFQCYTGGIQTFCPNCQMNTAIEYKKIWFAPEILIIYFHRIKHSFRGDVDFRNIISISNYFSYDMIDSDHNKINTVYSLKACISFANNNKYFADCFMPYNNQLGGIWMRYMDGEKRLLGDVEKEIHEYEPQLLIYELNNFQNQNNKDFMDIILKMMLQQQFKQLMQNFNAVKVMQQIQNQMMNPMNDYAQNNFNSNPMMQDYPDPNRLFLELKFICVPEFGDQSATEKNTIKVQILKNDTIKKAILNFFTKLGQDEISIKYFIFNNQILDKNDQTTLEEKGINGSSIIKAIKSNNFKEFIN